MTSKLRLSDKEFDFLKAQSVPLDAVYDARKRPKKAWIASVKENPDIIIVANSTPCAKAGHRLRTRSGHCAQCDTSKIAYARNYKNSKFLYLAVPQAAELVKIGITSDIERRQLSLNTTKYAGAYKWKIITHYDAGSNAGELENKFKSMWSQFALNDRYYTKSGRPQRATEVYRLNPNDALKAFNELTESNISSENSETKRSKNNDKAKAKRKNTRVQKKVASVNVVGGYYHGINELFRAGLLTKGSEVFLKANPQNVHDKNAIEVRLVKNDRMVGHLPANINQKWGERLANNQIVGAHVLSFNECKKSRLTINIQYFENEEASSPQTAFSNLPELKNDEAGVYRIECDRNQRIYIGASIQLKTRFKEHEKSLLTGTHHNDELLHDFKKYGSKAFSFTPIARWSEISRKSKASKVSFQTKLHKREASEISTALLKGRSLYNKTPDGQGYFSNSNRNSNRDSYSSSRSREHFNGGATSHRGSSSEQARYTPGREYENARERNSTKSNSEPSAAKNSLDGKGSFSRLIEKVVGYAIVLAIVIFCFWISFILGLFVAWVSYKVAAYEE